MSRNSKRACVIIPYFGKWPDWFPFYLYSCSKVGFIDFYYFTDCEIPKINYDNTHFVTITYIEYCQRVSKKLGIAFQPVNPYKLCDLKPFIGTVHADIARAYDFWGFADIDLVYGEMRSFITEEDLDKYDLITSHSTRVSGHLTLVRSISKFTNYWKRIPHWRQKLEAADSRGLDERAFTYLLKPSLIAVNAFYKMMLRKKYPPRTRDQYAFYQRVQNVLALFTPKVLFREAFSTIVPNPDQAWLYDCGTGRLSERGVGLPYLHFLFFKKTPYLNTENAWSAGCYHIPEDHIFTNCDVVEISTHGIRLVDVSKSTREGFAS